jgi:hypothetical protein
MWHKLGNLFWLVTAKMNNINLHLYLQKVLAIIQDYNHKKIADLKQVGFTVALQLK